jgi:hypothetical protein
MTTLGLTRKGLAPPPKLTSRHNFEANITSTPMAKIVPAKTATVLTTL